MAETTTTDPKMKPYAVIETGGKQYRVTSGDRLEVEKLDAEQGENITITPVLAASNGDKLDIGRPDVSNTTVNATVVEHKRGNKVINFKKKRRKGYTRKKGHRQELTVLKIDEIKQA